MRTAEERCTDYARKRRSDTCPLGLRDESRRDRNGDWEAEPQRLVPRRIAFRSQMGRSSTEPFGVALLHSVSGNTGSTHQDPSPRDRSGETTLYCPDGVLSVRLFVAPSRHAEERIEDVVAGQRSVSRMKPSFATEKDQGCDCFGVIPPDFLGDTAEELKGRDHPFKDCLGSFEGQSQHEGII